MSIIYLLFGNELVLCNESIKFYYLINHTNIKFNIEELKIEKESNDESFTKLYLYFNWQCNYCSLAPICKAFELSNSLKILFTKYSESEWIEIEHQLLSILEKTYYREFSNSETKDVVFNRKILKTTTKVTNKERILIYFNSIGN